MAVNGEPHRCFPSERWGCAYAGCPKCPNNPPIFAGMIAEYGNVLNPALSLRPPL